MLLGLKMSLQTHFSQSNYKIFEVSIQNNGFEFKSLLSMSLAQYVSLQSLLQFTNNYLFYFHQHDREKIDVKNYNFLSSGPPYATEIAQGFRVSSSDICQIVIFVWIHWVPYTITGYIWQTQSYIF